MSWMLTDDHANYPTQPLPNAMLSRVSSSLYLSCTGARLSVAGQYCMNLGNYDGQMFFRWAAEGAAGAQLCGLVSSEEVQASVLAR